jgi:hypothetical protein
VVDIQNKRATFVLPKIKSRAKFIPFTLNKNPATTLMDPDPNLMRIHADPDPQHWRKLYGVTIVLTQKFLHRYTISIRFLYSRPTNTLVRETNTILHFNT